MPPTLDLHLLAAINGRARAPLLDALLPLFSDIWPLWVVLAAGALYLILIRRVTWRKLAGLALVLGLAAGLADMSCNIVKDACGRLRPYQSVDGTHFFTPDRQWIVIEQPNPAPGARGSSFPSAHAATTMALATALILSRTTRAWIVLLPLCVGWSRIYVGKHFPLDVAAGWALGALCGLAAWLILRWLLRLIGRLRQRRGVSPAHGREP